MERAAEAGASRPHTRWRLAEKWPCVRQEEHLCLLLEDTKDCEQGVGAEIGKGDKNGLQHE